MSLVEFSERRARDNSVNQLPFKPLWVNNAHKRPEEFKKWFQTHLPNLEEFARYYIEDAWANLLWYTGEYLPHQPLRIRTAEGRDVEIPRQLTPFVINILGNLTDKRTSDLSVFKPNHETAPEDDTEQDRMTARVMKPIIEQIKRFNELPRLFDQAEKWNMVFGSIYAFVDFNDKIGDLRDAKKTQTKAKTKAKTDRDWETH